MKKSMVLELLGWTVAACIAAVGHAQDETLQVTEAALLEELTHDQLDSFLSGASPSDIELGNGESLEGLLHRLDQQATGLLFHPVAPCIILDTRQSDLPLLSGEERALKWRGTASDKNADAEKCGYAGFAAGSSAALLSFQFFESSGYGDLYLWPGGQDDREFDSSLTLSPDLSSVATVTASLCDPPSTRNCEAADLRLRLDGADSQAVIRVLGYFSRSPQVDPNSMMRMTELFQTSASTFPSGNEKTLESPFWETGESVDTIFYSGSVGVGLDPEEKLHVGGNIRATGELKVDADITIADLPSDDSTPSNSSLNFISREVGGSEHRWAFHSASAGGGWGVRPNSLALWEYDGRDCEIEDSVCHPRMVFAPESGYMGIGTDAPTERLEVEGNLKINGDVELSGRLVSQGDICIGNCGG